MPLLPELTAAYVMLAAMSLGQNAQAAAAQNSGLGLRSGSDRIVLAEIAAEQAGQDLSVPPRSSSGSIPARGSASAVKANPAPPGRTGLSQGPAAAPASGSPSSAGSNGKPYVIGPLDVLEVKVWNDAKLSGIFDVRPDGMMSMPLIGEVKASGVTVADLRKVIASKLAVVFVESPEVNIQILRYNSKKFFLFGGVHRTGEFPLAQDMTVLEALVYGSGFTDFANPKKVYVLRGDQKLKFNYKDVSQGKHMEQNILLQSGDKIFVPE